MNADMWIELMAILRKSRRHRRNSFVDRDQRATAPPDHHGRPICGHAVPR